MSRGNVKEVQHYFIYQSKKLPPWCKSQCKTEMIKTTLGSQFTLTTQLVTSNVCKPRTKGIAECQRVLQSPKSFTTTETMC